MLTVGMGPTFTMILGFLSHVSLLPQISFLFHSKLILGSVATPSHPGWPQCTEIWKDRLATENVEDLIHGADCSQQQGITKTLIVFILFDLE